MEFCASTLHDVVVSCAERTERGLCVRVCVCVRVYVSVSEEKKEK